MSDKIEKLSQLEIPKLAKHSRILMRLLAQLDEESFDPDGTEIDNILRSEGLGKTLDYEMEKPEVNVRLLTAEKSLSGYRMKLVDLMLRDEISPAELDEKLKSKEFRKELGIPEDFKTSDRSLRRWLENFIKGGYEALVDRRRNSGRHCTIPNWMVLTVLEECFVVSKRSKSAKYAKLPPRAVTSHNRILAQADAIKSDTDCLVKVPHVRSIQRIACVLGESLGHFFEDSWKNYFMKYVACARYRVSSLLGVIKIDTHYPKLHGPNEKQEIAVTVATHAASGAILSAVVKYGAVTHRDTLRCIYWALTGVPGSQTMNGSGARMIVSDNGPENIHHRVERCVEGLGIAYVHTHVRCPQEDSQVESVGGFLKRQLHDELIPFLKSRKTLQSGDFVICDLSALQSLIIILADDINKRPNFRGTKSSRLEHLASFSHSEENGRIITKQEADKHLRILLTKEYGKDGVLVENELFACEQGTAFVGHQVTVTYPADPSDIRDVRLHLDADREFKLKLNQNPDPEFTARKRQVDTENRERYSSMRLAKEVAAERGVARRYAVGDQIGIESYKATPTSQKVIESAVTEEPMTLLDLSI